VTLVLALDTATEQCAVGLGEWDGAAMTVLGETNLDVPRAALTHVVPAIDRLLKDCGARIDRVGAVVCGRGPGSFTGVRIGVATAKGIASGLAVPLYGVGTLDAVARRFAEHDTLVGVVGDAMRKEVYPALFRCRGGRVERLTAYEVTKPEVAATRWAADTGDEPFLLAGNGLAKYADIFTGALGDRARLTPSADWTPTGASLLLQAYAGASAPAGAGPEAGEGDPATLLPIYTRLSDAEEIERAKLPAGTAGGGRAGGAADGGRATGVTDGRGATGGDGDVPASGVTGPGGDRP
jgi:bifunctional N6-L-threonylcarbamoyladenine synthase / protein kinase Bud32